MEVSEAIRVGIQKAHTFGIGFVCIKADIRRAFDFMRHHHIHVALQSCKAPACLQHAFLQELSHASF